MSRKIDLSAFWDYTLEAVPDYAINYLVNDDPSGLSEEDLVNIDNFAERMSAAGYSASCFDFVKDIDGKLYIDDAPEAFFTRSPAFGLACNCYTCFFGEVKI